MTYAGAGFVLLSSDLDYVLLVHDARSGKWGFPKGHRESYDPDDLATAVRELFEETGLVPSQYTILSSTFKIHKGSQSYLFRYARLTNDIHKANLQANSPEEISELKWIPLADLLSADTVLDGNKYLRTWITDIKNEQTKRVSSLFWSIKKTFPSDVSMSATNVVT